MENSLGELIKLIRLKKGYTMEDFGKFFNTSKGTVNNWEKGRNNPNRENLKKIAELGNVSVGFLLGEGFIPYSDLNDNEKELVDQLNFIQIRDYNVKQSKNVKANIEYLQNKDKNTLEELLINNVIQFNELYSKENDEIKRSISVTLVQLSKLHSRMKDPNTTQEKKNEALAFYTNDLIKVNSDMIERLNVYFNEKDIK